MPVKRKNGQPLRVVRFLRKSIVLPYAAIVIVYSPFSSAPIDIVTPISIV